MSFLFFPFFGGERRGGEDGGEDGGVEATML